MYYLFLFAFIAKKGQEDLFALVKVSYKRRFPKSIQQKKGQKDLFTFGKDLDLFTRFLCQGTSHLKVLHQKNGLFTT